MATCPNCYRTITNHHCPDCEENERSKTRHGYSSNYTSTYTPPPPPNTPYSGGYGGGAGSGGKKLPATTGEIIFNVIAAIIIISIGLFVT